METDNIPLWSILTIEGLVVCLAVILFLVLMVRKSRRHIKILSTRINELNTQLRALQKEPAPSPAADEKTYRQLLEEQLAATRDYHGQLPGAGDIAMDLDPEAPEQRRVAAMRHALIVAEIEAHKHAGEPNWSFLADRYEQLLNFNRDYAPGDPTAELERLRGKHQKLQRHWLHCHESASSQYDQLSKIAAEQAGDHGLEPLLAAYHRLYQDFNEQFIEGDTPPDSDTSSSQTSPDSQQLRTLASQQHQVIDDLQKQLQQYQGGEMQHNLIVSLQAELQQQARFLNESNTCIQVLEEALQAANQKVSELQAQGQDSGEARAAPPSNAN